MAIFSKTATLTSSELSLKANNILNCLNSMVWRVNLDGDRDGLLIRFALKGVRFDSDALLFNRNMENKIKDFESKHKLFFDYLLITGINIY